MGKEKTLGEADASPEIKNYPSSIDVARLAGVSQSAVSRAFTDGASVSPKTRKKVEAAAEKLGYRPSIIPRIMLTHQSQLIGIVIGGMHNPFYASVLEIFSRRLREVGKTVLLFQVDHGEYIDEIIPSIAGYRVDGLISALSILSQDAAEQCAKMKIPVILFNGRLRNDWVASVCCDNVGGGRVIAKKFLEKGARKFGYISGLSGNMANEDRCAGFFGKLVEEGITNIRSVKGNFRFEGGYEGALRLCAEGDRPDAIFCANDLTAIGAIEALRHKLGLRVPEDVMVAGFDNIPAASWPSYELTTIAQDGPAMVDEAIRILDMPKDSIGRRAGGMLSLIPGELIERKTTLR